MTAGDLYDAAIAAFPGALAVALGEQAVWSAVWYWQRCNGGWQARRIWRALTW